MSSFPCLVRSVSLSGETRYALGDPLVDHYLDFVAGRCRPNTLTATAFDLKTFFTVIERDPLAVTPADVFEFLAAQRGDRRVVRMIDRESGLSARTIARRLSTVSGFYAYLVARGDTPVAMNPVPRGLATRRPGGSVKSRTVPLVRVPRTLPKSCRPSRSTRWWVPCGRGGTGRCRRDAAGRAASLRSARSATGRHRRRRSAGVRRGRQGRPSTLDADGQPVFSSIGRYLTRSARSPRRIGCSSC